MGCDVGPGSPPCTSSANEGANGFVPQCTANFECDNANGEGTVCAQYTLTAADGVQSKCITHCDNQIACGTAQDGNTSNIWAYAGGCSGASGTKCAAAGCAPIDDSKCTVISSANLEVCAGEINGNFSELTWNGEAYNTRTNLNVTCQWQVEDFATLAAVNEFERQFPQGGTCLEPPCPTGGATNIYNEVVMPYFCSLSAENTSSEPNVCPAENEAGKWVGNKCSRMIANNPEGVKCRQWISGLNSQTNTDAVNIANAQVYQGYCSSLQAEAASDPSLVGGEVNECLCLNRGRGGSEGLFDQVRDAITEAGSSVNELGQVGCWYSPCNSSIFQLIPRNTGSNTTVGKTYYPNNCPSVCQIINNIRGTIENSTVKESLNCKGGGNSGGGSTGDIKNFWEKYRWWILGILAIIFFVVFVVFIFWAYEGDKRLKAKRQEQQNALLFSQL